MRIATLAGIPLRLHWSFFALIGFYGLTSVVGQGLAGLVETGVLMSALFASVVLHELGHAIAARVFGIRTAHITLYPFGGVAAIQGMPRDPRQEAIIAIAGPAVNGALFVVFGGLFLAFGGWWLGTIALLNAAMGVFNLIPAFPMDGGRIFRAAMTPWLGWERASRVAITLGRVFAVGFLVAALAFGQLSLALVGAFLLFATWAEARSVRRLAATRRGAGTWTAARWRTGAPGRSSRPGTWPSR